MCLVRSAHIAMRIVVTMGERRRKYIVRLESKKEEFEYNGEFDEDFYFDGRKY